MFTSEEYCEMIILYGESGRNAEATARMYRERFPNRQIHPSANVILRLINRARTTGNLIQDRKGVGGVDRTVRTVGNEERVLQAFEEDGTRSVRNVANQIGLTKSTIHRILSQNNKHPYHYVKVQHLLPEDYLPRVQFCCWLLQQHEENPRFLEKVLFTDESFFCRQGTFNSHNYHMWSEENPHVFMVHGYQHRFSINLWAGIIGNSLVGPFELAPRLNGQVYRRFLQNNLPELLENVPLRNIINHWFQHDGAPAHFAVDVRNLLNQEYPNCWIGRGGPVHWPARSPDLTPLDFFLWGHIKNVVYRVSIENEAMLRDRIHQAVAAITPEMCNNARESLLRRAQLCIQVGGGIFEHLL